MATQAATGIETNLGFILEQVAREKGIEKRVLIETVEAAILKAAQSAFGPTRELEPRFNEETGQVDLYLYMTVVEEIAQPEREISISDVRVHDEKAKRDEDRLNGEVGDELGFQIFWHPADAQKARQQDEEFGHMLHIKQARAAFGRIAAQTAKQVLLARVRDAERDLIYNEFKDKQGELIKGIVRRFEKGNNLVVDLNKTEGVLPSREQTPRETYRPGDRIVALIKIIDREARGPQVVLSRQDPRLVEKLFEAEVPEIYEGIVRIVSVARESGARSKIAVASRDADVDPVGACVGMKGSRVQAVVQELRGEKIDIVPYDRDPAKYVIAAIQPAEVLKVIVDESDHRMELVVPDEKLSLAIGRKGQNVRLAAQLTGWRLDIISESRFRQLEQESLAAMQGIEGVDEASARALYRSGFRTPEEVADATPGELASVVGGNEGAAERLRSSAEGALEKKRLERLQAARERGEAVGERDKLLLIPGMTERTADALGEAGYGSLDSVLREDPDRLAIKAGLGAKKAQALQQAARAFAEGEWPQVEAARLLARQQAAHAAQQPKAEGSALGPLPREVIYPVTRPNPHPARSGPATAAGPSRTCVGCGGRGAPGDMVRFVLDLAGAADATDATDVAGTAKAAKGAKAAGDKAAVGARLDAASVGVGPKAAGRGAHAHARPSCLKAAAQKGLSRSFRRPVRAPAEALAGAVREASLGRAWALLRGAFARGQASAEAGGAGALAVVACDCPPSDFGPALREAVGRGEAVALGRRESLGGLAGRGALSMVFVRDAGVAKKIAWACAVADGAGPGRAVAEVG